MKKRLLSLLMALCLMLTLAPAAFAVEDDEDLSVTVIGPEINPNANAEQLGGEETSDLASQAVASASDVDAIATVSEGTMAEADFRNAVANGGTVALTGDVTLTGSTVAITKAVTIDGGSQYSITYSGSDTNAFKVTTDSAVVFKNVTINATGTNKRAISICTNVPNFTLENSTINVYDRAIWMEASSSITAGTGAQFTIKNSYLLNSRKPADANYDTWTSYGINTRGLSLWNIKDADVLIENSSILGFGYSIFVGGDTASATVGSETRSVIDTQNSIVTIKNSYIKGWTAFNIWGVRTTYNITNTELRGINLATGSSDSFATIVLNEGIYGAVPSASEKGSDAFANKFNISGGKISAYGSEESIAANNAANLISIGVNDVSEFNFSKYSGEKVQFKDDAGCCAGVFYSQSMTVSQMQTFLLYKISGRLYVTRTAFSSGDTLNWGSVLPTPYD